MAKQSQMWRQISAYRHNLDSYLSTGHQWPLEAKHGPGFKKGKQITNSSILAVQDPSE